MAFTYAEKAKVNTGVITCLFTTSSIYTAIIFWLFYKETINFKQIVGMALIIGGVICAGFKP